MKIMLTTVDRSEGIIDDPCLVLYYISTDNFYLQIVYLYTDNKCFLMR